MDKIKVMVVDDSYFMRQAHNLFKEIRRYD